MQDKDSKLLKILAGPVIFIVTLLLPFFGPVEARIGFGIMFWMVTWWVTVAVDIKITCLVPILVAAIYPYMPVEKVMAAYVHKHALLIIGASMVTAAWARWGLAKRIALRFLTLFGNNVQTQMVAWFIFCGVISFVMGNTPVGAIFAPIAVAALLYAGFESYQQRHDSKAASNILIAVAWGASVGGMTTPLGGGQAVVTMGIMEKYIGHEVYFVDWAIRMLPVSLLVMLAMSLFMYFFMRPEIKTFSGSKSFYRDELEKMGPMKYEEKIVLYSFLLIVLLAITRPMYVDMIKGPYFKWLHFSPLFFILAALLFFLPAKNGKKETILSIPTLTKYFPIAILFIWPAAVALGRILNKTGSSEVFAQWMQAFIGYGDVVSIAAISTGANLLSQMTSDTASAGVVMPLIIETFKDWGGLQYGAIAYMWIAGAALSWSYAVASATGAQGIVAGYGANLQRMFVYGLLGALISIIVTVLYFVVTISVLKLDFYILPPGA